MEQLTERVITILTPEPAAQVLPRAQIITIGRFLSNFQVLCQSDRLGETSLFMVAFQTFMSQTQKFSPFMILE